jgi:hypothetical protein
MEVIASFAYPAVLSRHVGLSNFPVFCQGGLEKPTEIKFAVFLDIGCHKWYRRDSFSAIKIKMPISSMDKFGAPKDAAYSSQN